MDNLKTIIMKRDGLSEEEAEIQIQTARSAIWLEGLDPEQVLEEEFGLEPDYIFDLIGY